MCGLTRLAVIVSILSPEELDEMEETQRPSGKIFIFGETEYGTSKVVMIPGVLGGKKLMIRTEILEGDDSWIIGRD